MKQTAKMFMWDWRDEAPFVDMIKFSSTLNKPKVFEYGEYDETNVVVVAENIEDAMVPVQEYFDEIVITADDLREM